MTNNTVENSDEVRQIDVGIPPRRFARGWHCLGLVDEFSDGKPHEIEAFGQSLVIFQGDDGNISVLNGFCPHMGGNLAHGTVKGNEIACPFHDWRWGGDGKCKSIPYARRVPPIARTRAWPTLIQNKQLFVWHDHEKSAPPEDVTIPRIDAVFDDGWTDWTWHKIKIEGANCREIVDNVVDMAHFFYVHSSYPYKFTNIFEGDCATQILHSKGRPDIDLDTNYTGENRTAKSIATYHGPSYMIDYLWNYSEQADLEMVLINCHYPVDANSFVLQYGVIVKRLPGISDTQADAIATTVAVGVERGFLQDVEIWKHKTRIDNPLLCEEDGPVYQLRRWYEQFYTNSADVTEEMARRFEFEVDTTRANAAWDKEVEMNMANRNAESSR